MLRVISGFQTGADIAGVKAAKALGLSTGGFIPQGFRTNSGSRPDYAETYGAVELSSSDWLPRTKRNVQEADVTFRFARRFGSPGELATLREIKIAKKLRLDFDCNSNVVLIHCPDDTMLSVPWHGAMLPKTIAAQIIQQGWQTLNIAGNSEQTAPGIELQVYAFLVNVFQEFQKHEHSYF